MSELNLTPAPAGHDDLYERLVGLHEGLSEADSLKVWAKLVLILANHIGDPQAVAEAIDLARPRAA